MYDVQIRGSRAAHTADAPERGRVLVVDDDKVFGALMLHALESRGHEADWAGSILEGLGSLYATRYDSVFIDLRLPDGSGLGLLRDATDEGLLADSAAIILTGHDFDEPTDIRVFHKPLELDPFLDRIGDLIAVTKRRRESKPQHSNAYAPPLRVMAIDNNRPSKKGTRLELVLYTSADSEKCQRALRTLQRVMDKYNAAQVNLTIRDLSDGPVAGDEDPFVFTQTLGKRGPGPRTWIVGNLDQDDLLIDLFDLSGVDRKRDSR